ncbi:PAS domain S-box-containing protein [Arenibacter palladensis]|uniref:histidine kinase n=1 Tax=Arenibacter palladensis TaxID=237373 RepID=A0A1M5AQF2_9FLAO|nr:PAS domain S-box protein [Arenibacter palladensis]SHF32405.1 PAS domain S-box-containing protein [Arenibacter palladensis]
MSTKDSELSEQYNKIFIEQAPTAIAMLDKDMRYIAVSQRWITDYKMEDKEIIGRSHYELFPEIGEDWKANHQKCLKGAIDICEEAPFKRADGTIQWIYWDVRPWYVSEGKIGGLLMHTGDITPQKEREKERARMIQILDKTNEVARIGTWEVNLSTNEVYWSKMVCEIHEVPENYRPQLETAINFYKEGESRETIQRVVNEAMLTGQPYDVEVELVTAKGTSLWTRAIGSGEFEDGKCVGLFGIFQDINEGKLAEQALSNANAELKAIFNSKSVAIITTNEKGIINHFNHGAEYLLGYSTSEIIGTQIPSLFAKMEEVERFRQDLSQKYGKDPLKGLAENNEFDVREWTYIKKDGSKITVQVTISAIKDTHGEITGSLTVASDITAIKNAEIELLRKNQVLNFAERLSMIGNWQWNTITNEVTWSSNLYKIFNVDIETRLTYDTYFSFVHPEDKEMVTNHVQYSLEEKKFPDLLHRIKLRNGTVKNIQLLAEIMTNDAGEVIELVGTCQDVTEQRLEEIKFRGLLESAPDAMVIVNEAGKINMINKQAEKLFGYSAKELKGKSVEILIPEAYSAKHPGHRAGFFANPKTRHMGEGRELFAINKKGKLIPIQISLSPLKTKEGVLVSAAIRDITSQKIAEGKILKAKEELEVFAKKLVAQNTKLADFTQITSHNLRAPVSNLNSLLGFYKLAQSEEEREDLFQKFESVIDHLTLTLNTLVEALNIRKNNNEDRLEEIEFNSVMVKTQEILAGEIMGTGAVIKSDFSKLPYIAYNKIYLESIFLNLVGNALKYRSADRVPEIYVSSGIENGKKFLKVTDNGQGINLKRHGHKLFGLNKVFHRHPDARGIGLFMTKTQIEAHGGSISAESEVNVGTTFNINFN